MAVGRHAELSVDWIACDGRGLCAELFPERIRLDRWGYPLIEGGVLDRRELVHARAAVSACPTLALRLGAVRPDGGERRTSAKGREEGRGT